MLTLQQIISEADTLVPNAYTNSDKVSWLNAINQDFFSVVKIPVVTSFTTAAGNVSYPLSAGVRAKNIDKVQIGPIKYRSMLTEDVQPGQNYWTFDDVTKLIMLTPAPFQGGAIGVVRYHRIATTTFLSSNLNAIPDAPEEYHWIYTVELCSKIAKAQDDFAKASNYEDDYRAALNVAAANYAKEGGDE